MSNIIYAADLFCGAGGTSTGLLNAAKRLKMDVRLLAINHWDVAIRTHQANHPDARHLTTGLESVTPADVVKQIGNSVPKAEEVGGGPGVRDSEGAF